MPLFALVKDSSPRIRRIALSASALADLEKLFTEQAGALVALADVEFDGRYSPESDEILRIDDFAEASDFYTAAGNPLGAPILKITDATLDTLTALFVVTNVNGVTTVCLQVFDRRRALTKSKFALISVGDGLEKLEKTGLILDTHQAAIIRGDSLFFKRFAIASRLFDLTSYYHEATDAELIDFAGHSAIAQSDSAKDFLHLADSTRTRKQVALILDSGILDTVEPIKIVNRAKKLFQLKIETMDVKGKKRIVLPGTRSALVDVLDFLQENVYKGCLTDTTFVSNSKRKKTFTL